MISPATGRLIVDEPALGAWNMAVDEALLESAAESDQLVLRYYQWSEPTLSLGYFQPYAERALHPASQACAVVRRSSGGGAILHDRELTYSLIVPQSQPLARRAQDLYTAIHGGLLRALESFDVTAARVPDDVATPPREPFLCFARRSPGDVIFQGAKIAGSAQRRPQGAVLQHGSILLARSPAAPELLGLAELAGQSLAIESLIERCSREFAAALNIDLQASRLTPSEHDRALALVDAKYAHDAWTQRR